MKKAMKSSFILRFFLLSALLMPSARAVGGDENFFHWLCQETNSFQKVLGGVSVVAYLTSYVLNLKSMETLSILSGLILMFSLADHD